MSSSSNENHMLAAWDTAAPLFLQEIGSLNKPLSEEGGDNYEQLIKDLENILDDFRNELENPDANPDFILLKENCNNLFSNKLTAEKVHDVQNILTTFFKYLLGTAIITFAAGLAIMLAAEVGALLGILTLSAVSFKGLGIVSAISGGAIAIFGTYSLFSTHSSAATALNKFITTVTVDNEEQTAEFVPQSM